MLYAFYLHFICALALNGHGFPSVFEIYLIGFDLKLTFGFPVKLCSKFRNNRVSNKIPKW